MKIKFERNDVVSLILKDGTVCGGTIISVDKSGCIVQTGPEDSDVEAIEKNSLRGMRILPEVHIFELIQESEEHDFFCVKPEQYTPPAPGSTPPGWDGIQMKWYHLPNGACTCGCEEGGNSSSPHALIGRR